MIADHHLLSSSSLPLEIIEHVVARVSCIRTIIRCTCVCKLWYSIIRSTHFIRFHLSLISDHNNNYINHRFLLCEHDEDLDKEDEGHYIALHNDNEEFQEYYKTTAPPKLRLVDACNGLICYNTFDDGDSLYLWNLIIRKVKKLPNPIPNLNNDNNIPQRLLFKLWFDRKANDYMILMNVQTAKTCNVQVYSLRTNSWKLIIDDAPDHAPCLTYIYKLVHVNGTLCWPALKDHKWIIISADTKSWMFQETSTELQAHQLYLAPSNHDDSLLIIGSGDMDGFLFKIKDGCVVFNVYKYTMDELNSVNIGDDDRLIEHRVQHNYALLLFKGPIGVRHDGELLFQDPMSVGIFSYNVESKRLMEFDTTRVDHCILQVTPFFHTLDLLDDTEAYGI